MNQAAEISMGKVNMGFFIRGWDFDLPWNPSVQGCLGTTAFRGSWERCGESWV